MVDPAIASVLARLKGSLVEKEEAKAAETSTRPDLSEEEIEDLKAEFAMLQEEFEAQMAASDDRCSKACGISKSDDVEKSRPKPSRDPEVFCQASFQPRHQRRISVPPASPPANVSRRQPATADHCSPAVSMSGRKKTALAAELTGTSSFGRHEQHLDRLIDALDDDDEFDMQDMLKLSGFGGRKGGKGEGRQEAKANLRNPPATKRLQTPGPTTENLPTSFSPRRSRRTSEMVIDRSGGAGNILISVSGPDGQSPSSSAIAMMIVENGQEYEVPMDGPWRSEWISPEKCSAAEASFSP